MRYHVIVIIERYGVIMHYQLLHSSTQFIISDIRFFGTLRIKKGCGAPNPPNPNPLLLKNGSMILVRETKRYKSFS